VDFPPSRFRLGRVYCNRKCYASTLDGRTVTRATRLKLANVARRRWGTQKPNVSCFTCGKRWHRPDCELNREKHFCSRQCRTKRRESVCAECGKPIVIRAGRNDGRKRFCSIECNAANRRGPFIVKNGYRLILLPDHPRSDSYGYVREHIAVMERVIGRRLTDREVVHHKNGDKQNNHPDNLSLFSSNSEHLRVCRHTRNARGQASSSSRRPT